MFSMFEKIKSIFYSSNSNKRKSSESIDILSESITRQCNKENDVTQKSVYISIYENGNSCNNKFIDTSYKSQTTAPKKPRLSPSLDKPNIESVIGFIKPKQSAISIDVTSKRTKRTQGNLSHFNFNSKSHLLDRNLIDKLTKPSLYSESRQNHLQILETEKAVINDEVQKHERSYMEEFAQRFRELWSTTPTVLPRYSKKPSLPKITDEMKELVQSKLTCKRRDTVIVEEFSLSVTVTDLISLQPKQWLTDNIINFYLELIFARNAEVDGLPKVQILTSFFYPKLASAGYSGVKRWTKRRPIFDSQMVLVPIHLGNHWCLVTIDLDNQEVFYYDSLKTPNPRLLSEIKDFLIEDSKDKLNKALDTDSWTFKQRYDGPAQTNGFDCGVFLCQTAEYASRRAKMDFLQEQIDYFREKMSFEILSGRLL